MAVTGPAGATENRLSHIPAYCFHVAGGRDSSVDVVSVESSAGFVYTIRASHIKQGEMYLKNCLRGLAAAAMLLFSIGAVSCDGGKTSEPDAYFGTDLKEWNPLVIYAAEGEETPFFARDSSQISMVLSQFDEMTFTLSDKAYGTPAGIAFAHRYHARKGGAGPYRRGQPVGGRPPGMNWEERSGSARPLSRSFAGCTA